MMAMIKQDPNTGEIKGWAIAVDIDDMRRYFTHVDMDVAGALYRMPSFPPLGPGKYPMQDLNNHILLVT